MHSASRLVSRQFHLLSPYQRFLHVSVSRIQSLQKAQSIGKSCQLTSVNQKTTLTCRPTRSFATMATESKWNAPAPGEVPGSNKPETHFDIHTHANLNEIRPGHIEIDWTVDWDKKILIGQVTHDIHIVQDGADKVILDTSFLDIQSVFIVKPDGQRNKAEFALGKRDGTLGSPLSIELGQKMKKGEEVKIAIDYSTTEKCTALGWLAKEQTESKSMPFLYSQAQAIHARAMLPCVDSPSHKITYTSKVKSKYPILMSALADGSIRATETKSGEARLADDESGLGVYRFRQPVGIPSYLIAIVGGNLVFRELAPRVGVWAEPTMIDRAEWEFKEEANRFLIAAEQTISPYSWTRYDCVVLPPSFPYGGMENANMTTLTPALISGDRSQTDVLLHELGHSWSGNLTSCANWTSFWLNEGINVWIERLLLQVVHGPEAGPAIRELHYIIGQKAFEDAVDQFAKTPRFQRLVPVFEKGEDPDDAFSSIPYEKGSIFILYLERLVGGLDVFLPFIQSYFKAYYDRSISTEEWKQHLFDFYKGNEQVTEKLNTVKWDEWLHGEGKQLPAKVDFKGVLAKQAYDLTKKWVNTIKGKTDDVQAHFGPKDIAGWDPNQVILFLSELRSEKDIKVPAEIASQIDKLYGFGSHKNTEIRFNFFMVALQDKDGKYAKEAATWVSKQGRMKYCRPLYRSIFKVEPDLARETFVQNKSFYHPIAAAMIEMDLDMVKIAKGSVSSPVRKKLVAVCGSTGTGKSQLAVELAQHLSELNQKSSRKMKSEIISADSMQMYRGLDVITNKAREDEMGNIPHHLLSFLDPELGQEYDVGTFVEKANEIIQDLYSKPDHHYIPIVVGGTNYYLQHLLLPGNLVSLETEGERDEKSFEIDISRIQEVVRSLDIHLSEKEVETLHLIIQTPDDRKGESSPTAFQMWDLLNKLDPKMASRWHVRDTRKVRRSLCVVLETGKRHSEWYEEQRKREEAEQENVRSDAKNDDASATDTIIFWVYSDLEKLRIRLDERVDKMIERGLLREIVELRSIARKLELANGRQIEYTRGIFQTIGYKEFDEYLTYYEGKGNFGEQPSNQLLPQEFDEKGKELFSDAIQSMKIATRQYAKRQISWLRNRLAKEIVRRKDENVHLIVLDASEPELWSEKVKQPAFEVIDAFLSDQKLPLHRGITTPMPSVKKGKGSSIAIQKNGELSNHDDSISFVVCQICTSDEPGSEPFMVMKSKWQDHLHGRVHKNRMFEKGLLVRKGPDLSQEAQKKREARQKEKLKRTQIQINDGTDEDSN